MKIIFLIFAAIVALFLLAECSLVLIDNTEQTKITSCDLIAAVIHQDYHPCCREQDLFCEFD